MTDDEILIITCRRGIFMCQIICITVRDINSPRYFKTGKLPKTQLTHPRGEVSFHLRTKSYSTSAESHTINVPHLLGRNIMYEQYINAPAYLNISRPQKRSVVPRDQLIAYPENSRRLGIADWTRTHPSRQLSLKSLRYPRPHVFKDKYHMLVKTNGEGLHLLRFDPPTRRYGGRCTPMAPA